MPDNWLVWILSNFDLAMFILACFFILLHQLIKRNITEAEIVFRWMVLFAAGFTGIYAFIFHAFLPEVSAISIGWQPSPFQFEVAMANLAFGVMAILAFNASYNFRLAVVIGLTLWLWGDASGHLYQLMKYNNYTVGNAGSWFWMDMLVPLILILCMMRMRRSGR